MGSFRYQRCSRLPRSATDRVRRCWRLCPRGLLSDPFVSRFDNLRGRVQVHVQGGIEGGPFHGQRRQSLPILRWNWGGREGLEGQGGLVGGGGRRGVHAVHALVLRALSAVSLRRTSLSGRNLHWMSLLSEGSPRPFRSHSSGALWSRLIWTPREGTTPTFALSEHAQMLRPPVPTRPCFLPWMGIGLTFRDVGCCLEEREG